MREKKWTKGPWKRDPISPRQIIALNGRSVCRAHLAVGSDVEPDANARLIEAAPDLVEALEALKFIIEEMLEDDRCQDDDVLHDELDRADDALAKAYGEGE